MAIETMIERVAYALMASFQPNECDDLKIKHYYGAARAAIAAMREPTENMECDGVCAVQNADDGACEPWDHVYTTWTAMIDSALKDA